MTVPVVPLTAAHAEQVAAIHQAGIDEGLVERRSPLVDRPAHPHGGRPIMALTSGLRHIAGRVV
ncbi:hypothetical protein [Streptomyces sp. NPDC056169]|uniref:hypothetical protein n=1 Tax=Streptomyces sp. NPDC056169 TaxID=3345734 RepID=UPI0035D8C0F1